MAAALLSQPWMAQPGNTVSGTPEPAPEGSRIEIHEAFPSRFVQARDIEVYLPAGYDGSRRYPVCYMHDGKNLFSAERSYSGEWGVDEALDTLGYELIVVGIANNGLRVHVYMPGKPYAGVAGSRHASAPQDPARFGHEKGEVISDDYLRFLVQELKPWVDARYATLPDKAHTYIAGSSMGGLISCYALGEYPEVFGAAACLSIHLPALDGVFLEYLASGKPSAAQGARLWLDRGDRDLDATYAPYMDRAGALLQQNGWVEGPQFSMRVYEGTTHHESDWRRRMPEVLRFLLGY